MSLKPSVDSAKRKADEEECAAADEPVKKARVAEEVKPAAAEVGSSGAVAAEEADRGDEAEVDHGEVEGDEEAKADAEPALAGGTDSQAGRKVKVGYKTFQNAEECIKYFSTLLKEVTKNQDLNEYEHAAVLELLQKGHSEPEKKTGSGVRAIQVRQHEDPEMASVCFYLVRTDGSSEDFSYRKCIANLFPGTKLPEGKKGGKPAGGRGRGGRARGFKGRGGRGRGGRGRGGRG